MKVLFALSFCRNSRVYSFISVVKTKFVAEHATFMVISGDRMALPPAKFVAILNFISITGVA